MENDHEFKPASAEPIESAIETILKAVPEEQKGEALKALMIIKEESFEGPIPSPSIFKEYESTLPGSADRILKMAESQQSHRIELEKSAINSQMKQGERGQFFGFVIFLFCIALTIVFILFDMKTFAGIFATGTMAVLVGLFIHGKVEIKKDLKSKKKSTEE